MNQVAKLPVSEVIQRKHSNYGFLEGSFPEIYRVSQEVEKYYSTDHSCCLLKARLFIELWCHEVGDILKLKPPVYGDLVNKIKQIEMTGKIPDYLIADLNNIRREANRSAHITLRMDGQWSSDWSLSQTKLKSLMLSMFDLAKYLTFQLRKVSELQIQEWQEPVCKQVEGELCHAALLGNKDAAFSLARSASLSMQAIILKSKSKSSCVDKKDKLYTLQRDLSYFLDKAHRLGHKETWLEYANSYSKKLLKCPENQSIESCYKKALKIDLTGESAFHYGAYLLKNNQSIKGLDLIKQAAEKMHHEAIIYLQEYYYKKEENEYTNWVAAGVEAQEPRSFLLDFEYKLSQFELDLHNELLKKKAKSAFINAKARQIKGIVYYQAYCTYRGYWGNSSDIDENLKSMVENYKQLPAFLHYEDVLFNAIVKKEQFTETAIEIASHALLACTEEKRKAQMKFDFAMLIWKELLKDRSVQTPLGMKQLIREAAREGSQEADQFIKSPKGKALLRDQSYVVITTTKTKVDRKKQKSAKKSARKARQK